MTAFDNIKTNNWPSASNDFEDFLVLELPLNNQAALTSSRRDIVAGSKVLTPKRTLTNSGGVNMQYARVQPDYGATGFTKSSNWRTDYDDPEDGIFNGDGTSTQAAIDGSNDEHWFAFATPLTNVTKVETRMGHDGNQSARAYMGSGTTNYISTTAHATYFTVYSGAATTFSKMGWRSNNGSGASVYDIRITDDTGTYVLTSNENSKKHYDNNAYFNGSSTLLLSNSGITLGGDYCIECYFRTTGQPGEHTRIFEMKPANVAFYVYGSHKQPYVQVGSGSSLTGPNNSWSTDTWHHFATTRQSGTTRLFIDGVEKASGSTTAAFDIGTTINLNGNSTGSYRWVGAMQDFRIYNGAAKYTSNFTPPGAILG